MRDRALEAYEELMGLDIFEAVDVVLGEGGKVRSCPLLRRLLFLLAQCVLVRL